ncbi:MAG TPA: AraC family transcriptional regulator ligand-binding domain-containing protein [Caulobacteraceae bacterium]|nr:AraC family transcriptional regulator ligand-binding domain-containing protein [Caulobacteraceae bacterium]
MTPRYFRLLARHFGVTPELRAELLAGTGVNDRDLDDHSHTVTLGQQRILNANLDRVIGEHWVVSAPDLWAPSTLGALGVAYQTAPDLKTVLEVLVTRGRISGPSWTYRLRSDAEFTTLVFQADPAMTARNRQLCLEMGFIAFRHTIGLQLGRTPTALRFRFAAPIPAYAGEIRAVLGEVEFSAPEDAVVFPTSWLSTRAPLHDPVAFRLAMSQVDAEYAALNRSVPIVARVEDMLRFSNGRLTLPAVASQLGVSERTLVRRLQQAGVTFRELVDAEQRRRAEALISAGDAKMANVAEQLGYSDPSSFARARRRWAKAEA